MQNNNRNIAMILAALVAGLAIGYFFFGNDSSRPEPSSEEQMSADKEEIWTCSMHPQIRQSEPGDCPICGMDLIPLSENTSNDPLVLEMTQEAARLADIQTTTIGTGAAGAVRTLRLSGKVQADERLASSQVAHIPGRIEKLYVSFTGEPVRQGQKLADLYSPELITAQRELLEAKRMTVLQTELLEAARDKLRYWKVPETIIQEIEESGTLREVFPIYSDETGIVLNRRIAVGDYVRKGDVLFDMVNLSRVWVLFDAYEEDLGNIRLGSQIQFTTPAIPGKTFSARVSFIDPVINPQTRVASIRVEVNNPGGQLKPEMLVYGTLESREESGASLTVPKSAVLWTGIRSVVYVKIPDMAVPSFQFREIEIGDRMGDQYAVISGLEAGEEVVTNGSFAIDAAAQLNNQASMMNRDVSIRGVEQQVMLPDYTSSTPLAFKKQLAFMADAYLVVKDALVSDDAASAAAAAGGFLKALAQVDMSLLSGEAHHYWMDQQQALEAHGKSIQEAADDLETQRKQFDFLSQAIIKSVKAFGVPEGTYFVQHCPMAFDNDGADWLSDEKEIRNPYFGAQMLTCGIVEDTIDETYKNPMSENSGDTPAGE